MHQNILEQEAGRRGESDQGGAACSGETLILNPNLLYFSIKVRHAEQPGRRLQIKEKESGVHRSLARPAVEMITKDSQIENVRSIRHWSKWGYWTISFLRISREALRKPDFTFKCSGQFNLKYWVKHSKGETRGSPNFWALEDPPVCLLEAPL